MPAAQFPSIAMNTDPESGFTTRAVHESCGFSENTGAVMPPVFLTSTFENGNPGGFDYTGADCIGWMKEAGFREARVEHLVGPESMVIATK